MSHHFNDMLFSSGDISIFDSFSIVDSERFNNVYDKVSYNEWWGAWWGATQEEGDSIETLYFLRDELRW